MSDHNSSRRERLGHLHKVSMPAPGTQEAEQLRATFAKLDANPRHRKAMKDMHERAVATLNAQLQSGAGYPADQTVRHFLGEYNGRLMRHGRNSMPASFELGEAFFFTPKAFVALCLLPERDYLISFTDFLDYATGAEAPTADVAAAWELEDNVIYNISSLDTVGELLLETDSNSSFAFVAASMVRRQDELSFLLVLGEQRPFTEMQAMATSLRSGVQTNPSKAFLNQVDTTDDEPLTLPDTDLLRTLALVRFNLREKRMEGRLLMREFTKSFSIVGDTQGALAKTHDGYAERAARAAEDLDAIGSVWEVAKTLLLLPSYLAARIDVVQSEVINTKLGSELRGSLKARRAIENALADARVVHRRISAVRIARSEAAILTGRSYRAPAFQVPVDGFWRHFADSTRQGHDEAGELVVGKTWVRPHLRHKDKEAPAEPKVVYIKASLTLARQRLERFRKSDSGRRSTTAQVNQSAAGQMAGAAPPQALGLSYASTQVREASTAQQGAFLYVMRCPAHGRDIYKVGFTDRDPELRARELSSATASPTHFLVVQAWPVSNGLAAEQAAHRRIEQFRLSTNREFFQGAYVELRKGIEGAIESWLVP